MKTALQVCIIDQPLKSVSILPCSDIAICLIALACAKRFSKDGRSPSLPLASPAKSTELSREPSFAAVDSPIHRLDAAKKSLIVMRSYLLLRAGHPSCLALQNKVTLVGILLVHNFHAVTGFLSILEGYASAHPVREAVRNMETAENGGQLVGSGSTSLFRQIIRLLHMPPAATTAVTKAPHCMKCRSKSWLVPALVPFRAVRPSWTAAALEEWVSMTARKSWNGAAPVKAEELKFFNLGFPDEDRSRVRVFRSGESYQLVEG